MKTMAKPENRPQTTPAWAQKVTLAVIGLALPNGIAVAGSSFEEDPINYLTAPANDPVARLQKRIDRGDVEFDHDGRHGYLPAVLEAMNVPQSAQVMVFSKTSFQRDNITPATPRAIYFSDDVYVGWVQGGDVVEVSAVEPQLGAIFYSLDQRKVDKPAFLRQNDQCLQCHASALTRGIPGHVVRSVFPNRDGLPLLQSGTHRTNHTSPLKERWGGWYVTGTHGKQRHMGNVFVEDKADPTKLDLEAGANVTDLSGKFDVSPYLVPHSDIVALMVLEHQVEMHNLFTHANYSTRTALRDQAVIDNMVEEPQEGLRPSTKARIKSAGEKLVEYLLYAEEEPLTEPINGTSGFAEEFAKRGPRDPQGRSLRDLDMTTRMFKYPCSYLIYSEAFDNLPDEMKKYVYGRLWEILNGLDESDDYDHLTRGDRREIREILIATKTDLPDYWKA
jgi:hypothetical protein